MQKILLGICLLTMMPLWSTTPGHKLNPHIDDFIGSYCIDYPMLIKIKGE